MSELSAYFVRVGEHRFLPQRFCAGAWNPAELHISPVNGLLMHEMERWLSERPGEGKLVTRISCDYLGVLGFDECDVRLEVLRPGRAVELVEGVLSQNGRAALRARVWRLAVSDTSPVQGGELDPLPPVEAGEAFNLSMVWPGDYIASLDMRAINGPNPGRTTAWITTPLQIVDGEPTTDLARFALLVDTSNGIAVRRPPEEWQFPNLDLTIHLFRQPEGAWVGFDTSVTFGPAGHGLTSTDLYDARGHAGRAAQTCPTLDRVRGGMTPGAMCACSRGASSIAPDSPLSSHASMRPIPFDGTERVDGLSLPAGLSSGGTMSPAHGLIRLPLRRHRRRARRECGALRRTDSWLPPQPARRLSEADRSLPLRWPPRRRLRALPRKDPVALATVKTRPDSILGASHLATAELSTVPYATVLPHPNPLASRAAAARDRTRASLVHSVNEATVAGFRGRLCDGRCARPAARQAPRR